MSGRVYTLISPLRVPKNKRGDLWSLNLNNYRNTCPHALNNYKKKYKELMQGQFDLVPVLNAVSVEFRIYGPNRREFDIGNVESVIEKFFMDALVEAGKLPDDNYNHYPDKHCYYMGIDKDNPRAEIKILEIVDAYHLG